MATEETVPGVWEEKITERNYYGDVLRDTTKRENGSGLNDDISIANRISIVADDYAYGHIANLRFIKWMGASWKITNVEIQRPRLILTIGGVYNEPQT